MDLAPAMRKAMGRPLRARGTGVLLQPFPKAGHKHQGQGEPNPRRQRH
jgi:hypothetical protein